VRNVEASREGRGEIRSFVRARALIQRSARNRGRREEYQRRDIKSKGMLQREILGDYQ